MFFSDKIHLLSLSVQQLTSAKTGDDFMKHDSDGNKVKTLDITWRHTRTILERVKGNATGW